MITGKSSKNYKVITSERICRAFRLATAFLLFGISVFFHSASASASEDSSVSAIKENQNTQIKGYTETQMAVRAAVAESALAATKDINTLAIKLSLQEEEIKSLKQQIERFEKPSDINTITIVLTCVSVLITILGVVFAILSIFGYTNIREEAVRSAKTAARETVEKITKDELPAETERSIIELIKKERFDKIIQDAVENVMYRGISIADEASDNGGQN